MSDAETFTRLYYNGTVQMGMSADEFWLMPIGLFMDLLACHNQFLNRFKKKTDTYYGTDDFEALGLDG